MGGFNPFGPQPPAKPASNEFNVDDIVKRIDAKIAELEEEERQEKLKQEENNKITDAKIEVPKEDNKNVVDTNENTENKQEINFDLSSDLNRVSDDQFFDDFFNDE